MRCTRSDQIWAVPSERLGETMESLVCGGGSGECAAASAAAASSKRPSDTPAYQVMGPMWVGAMHDTEYVSRMAADAEARGWDDAAALLGTMAAEAEAEAGGALLYYHLGPVQRRLVAEGLNLPPLTQLIDLLRRSGHTASTSHIEKKAVKTSATVEELVRTVRLDQQEA